VNKNNIPYLLPPKSFSLFCRLVFLPTGPWNGSGPRQIFTGSKNYNNGLCFLTTDEKVNSNDRNISA